MKTWHPILPADELAPGQWHITTVQGRSIGIYRSPHKLYAILNVCPHNQAEICRGRVTGRMTFSPEKGVCYEEDALTLRCPWHHWEFDLDSGKPVISMPGKLKHYPVKAEAGEIWVEL